ncbi:hypothetical protein M422DRAFT_229023 [Sphaerobolus stellatus SS14]|uniref:Peptide hydrolase n=1 Tax=Sphaerobolus stellatus (strain SS14) TaxID=990650 RepID=A0A0C9VXI0_SPHS4|nr:hypothetical protein M422DRAFT_229023 [Sphaerobolus stellatus SS14]
MASKKWSLLPSLLLILPIFLSASFWAVTKHYALPTPVGPVARDDLRLSEAHMLDVAKHLSETIGYRTVGTKEHAEGDAWMVEQVKLLKKECDNIVKNVHSGRHLECEIWRQEGSGKHRFDIMGYRLYKNYVDLTNIIVRLSNGTPAGKEHALLINAHVDSTVSSPGAADDALSVGVMLECIRVLVHTPGWEPSNALIFLFNNAEESLQDASHLYSTQHETAKTVRAVINLEAAGMSGPELLFQATSEEMVQAYSKVPRPYGTVLANDIFSSGIIMSDTDFRQFEEYMNVTGVDMAVVGHSYFYHTQKDLVEYVEPGVAQHMAENTLALLHHFTEPSSPLPSLQHVVPHKPRIAYISVVGTWFFSYSFDTATTAYTTLFAGTLMAIMTQSNDPPSAAAAINLLKTQVIGARNILSGLLGALVSANVVAAIMWKVLDRSLSWYSREWLPIALYGPPAFVGALLPQLYFMSPAPNERNTLTGLLLLLSGGAAFFQIVFEVGSAAFLFIPGVALFAGLASHILLDAEGEMHIPLRTYVVGGIIPLLVGSEVWCGTADVFVPLTGRMGDKAPAEFIIASMTAFLGFYTIPLLIPFAHRFGKKMTQHSVFFFLGLTVFSMAYMANLRPFDSMHPKRMFIMHSENITSGEIHLNIADADSSPGLKRIATDLAQKFGEPFTGPAEFQLSQVPMTDWNADWDTLYPFSAFLTPYKLRLSTSELQRKFTDTFTVKAINDVIDTKAGTRSLTLKVEHPGVIWTVVAFDAHVLSWSLDNNPPTDFARHHIKEASFYGVNTWSVDIVIKLPEGEDQHAGLKVNFVGTKEAVQWPSKKKANELGLIKGTDQQDLKFLEEIHAWLEKREDDSVDALLFGTVGGVVII